MKNLLRIRASEFKGHSIRISGYRHSINLIIATISALPLEKVQLENVPHLSEMDVMLKIFSKIGGKYTWLDKTTLFLNSVSINSNIITNDLSQLIHGALYYYPALVSRFGHSTIGTTGGCQIGSEKDSFSRPFWHIIKALEKGGCQIYNEAGS